MLTVEILRAPAAQVAAVMVVRLLLVLLETSIQVVGQVAAVLVLIAVAALVEVAL